MTTHVKVIAVLYAVFGTLGLAAAVLSSLFFGILAAAFGTSGESGASFGSALLGLTGAAMMVVLLAMAVPAIVTAWGLWTFRPWARLAGIVLAVVMLVHFPMGTLLGIYALFILFQHETEKLFRA